MSICLGREKIFIWIYYVKFEHELRNAYDIGDFILDFLGYKVIKHLSSDHRMLMRFLRFLYNAWYRIIYVIHLIFLKLIYVRILRYAIFLQFI